MNSRNYRRMTHRLARKWIRQGLSIYREYNLQILDADATLVRVSINGKPPMVIDTRSLPEDYAPQTVLPILFHALNMLEGELRRAAVLKRSSGNNKAREPNSRVANLKREIARLRRLNQPLPAQALAEAYEVSTSTVYKYIGPKKPKR